MTQATRIATIATEYGKVSYWQHKEEVYRLNEYEPVQFDIYGLPLGARWETNFFHWPDLLKPRSEMRRTLARARGQIVRQVTK